MKDCNFTARFRTLTISNDILNTASSNAYFGLTVLFFFFFNSDDWAILKDEVKTYQMIPSSSLNARTFFSMPIYGYLMHLWVYGCDRVFWSLYAIKVEARILSSCLVPWIRKRKIGIGPADFQTKHIWADDSRWFKVIRTQSAENFLYCFLYHFRNPKFDTVCFILILDILILDIFI